MYQSTAVAAMQQYQNVGIETGVMDASPHRIVDLLLQGAIDKLARAKCFSLRNNRARLGETISSVLAIIGTLRSGLDHDRGGQISENLLALYDYMETRLLDANFDSDEVIFDEVASLLGQISEGWKSIPIEFR